jgi:hypothetical protein
MIHKFLTVEQRITTAAVHCSYVITNLVTAGSYTNGTYNYSQTILRKENI